MFDIEKLYMVNKKLQEASYQITWKKDNIQLNRVVPHNSNENYGI